MTTTTQTPTGTRTFSGEDISSLVAELLGTQLNPVLNSPSPQPWGAYIRKALKQGVFGPGTQHWQYYALSQNFQASYLLAALNPQPLPPRSAFMIAVLQEVIDQVRLIHEVASALNQRGQEQSIIIVSGSFDKYIDDIDELCGPIIKIILKHKKWRGDDEPIPHPNWDKEKFSAIELLIAANLFKQNASDTADENMRAESLQACKRLTNMAFERMH